MLLEDFRDIRNGRAVTKDEDLSFTEEEAIQIGQSVGADFDFVDLNEFKQGLMTELEHFKNPKTALNLAEPTYIAVGKIALAHLMELPDYYSRLAEMEGKK